MTQHKKVHKKSAQQRNSGASAPQAGILQEIPEHCRYLYYSLSQTADADSLIEALGVVVDGDKVVLGLGKAFMDFVGARTVAVKDAPVYSNAGIAVGVAPYAIWLWLRGTDRGELVYLTLKIQEALGDDALLEDMVDGFRFREGRDLTGYVDGTENPAGAKALQVCADGRGGSFVAVQKWVHDLGYMLSLPEAEQDAKIGRHKRHNEEFAAPPAAHVKRAEQEHYSPQAFLLRRSMPWADFSGEGLVFVAFASSFYAFDAIMQRMLGQEDGIVDSLFSFSRPLATSFFYCPPMTDGRPDLGALAE